MACQHRSQKKWETGGFEKQVKPASEKAPLSGKIAVLGWAILLKKESTTL